MHGTDDHAAAPPGARADLPPTHHGHAHDHDHEHGHDHPGGLRGALLGIVRPHRHDAAESIDDAVTESGAGMRALKLSFAGLAVTAVLQIVVLALTGSVALLSDTIHNLADALTAVPLAVAFRMGRRRPTDRYTYGYGRAEDLAGVVIVFVVFVSGVAAAWEAVDRLVHPRPVHDLALVAAAGLIGFVGNEAVAEFRLRVGRRIGSAALEADGRHARTDGFTSLGVLVGAAGVALGWRAADPVVGLIISVAILAVTRTTARDIYRRLMDAVDPALVATVRSLLESQPGVEGVDAVRVRWIGHELHAEAEITSDPSLSLAEAHDVAEAAHHELLHHVRRLTTITIHSGPAAGSGPDPHAATAHHRRPSGQAG